MSSAPILSTILVTSTKRHGKLKLHDGPVAAEIDKPFDFAKGHGVDRAAVVADAKKAQRITFHRAANFSELDILSNAKRVREEIKDPGDDVAHKGLSAQPNRNADDTGAREQRSDIDPERLQKNCSRWE
jgi:hypothetical protein